MSRLEIPLKVEPALGRPRRICVDGHWYGVRSILDGWVVRSRWWGHDEERHYLRMDLRSASDARVIEAFRVGPHWSLARVLD